MTEQEVQIEHHPPERAYHANVLGGVCCSCCCCCCCLHTAGSLLGAAVGSGWAMLGDVSAADQSGWPSESVAVGVYWLVVVPLSVLVFAGTAIGSGLGWAAGVLILGLPVIQVFAAAVALIAVVLLPVKDRKRAALAVGKVSLASVVAFVLGALIMLVVGGVFIAVV